MSERLYYQDAYTTRFTADVVEQVEENGRLAIILDRSYFYPTSGGQPADRGKINDLPVVDVTIRPQDEAVLHWLESGPVEGKQVTAVINWQRRFDHMQQHTGQHILSQAFIRLVEAQTIGFHLSDDTVTIDLDMNQLLPGQVRQVEQLANQIVWENRPINIRTVTLEEAQKMPLRKLPPNQKGQLRLIEIADFDLTACGGTHVRHTGSVGIIKVIKLEKIRGQVRVTFNCGGRALADYRQKNEIVNQLTANLTTGQSEIATAVHRLQTELKEAHRTIKKMRAVLLQGEVNQLLDSAKKIGPVTIITHVFDDQQKVNLRAAGNLLTQHGGVVAFLGLAASKSQLLFCRSDNAPGKMNELLQTALRELGNGGGGGSEQSAQGGAAVDYGRLQQAIDQAAQKLAAQISK